ncbi:MAG: hypothetical protein ACHQIO_05300 [Nevskiales bacterium]
MKDRTAPQSGNAMSTPNDSKSLAGLWKKLGGRIAVTGNRDAPPMAVVDIRHGDDAQAGALIDALLAFAQSRGLGIEHNLIKNRLVFYQDANTPAAMPPQSAQAHHPNVLAFPAARAKMRCR